MKLIACPTNTLVDEDVSIKVTGLKPKQKVTLTSEMLEEREQKFECFAFYKADKEGNVTLSKSTSFGGMYNGIEPMGLFWAMKGSKINSIKYLRLIKRDVSTPLVIKISVYSSWKGIHKLCRTDHIASTTVYRWYKKKAVKRVPVREGRIRGTLFIPEGLGPFQTIVDMFGGAGGLFEYRASMLASRGFMTLSLAIYAYDDLPDVNTDVHLEYFEEAVEFLQSLNLYDHAGIGAVAISYGGTLAMAMGAYVPGVRAVVCINGFAYADGNPIQYKGYSCEPPQYDISKFNFRSGNIVEEKYGRIMPNIKNIPKNLMECYKSDCSFLLLASGDDGAVQMDVVAQDFVTLKNKFKLDDTQWKVRYYPGAGHLLELPNTPLTNIVHLKPRGYNIYYGGNTFDHAKAQKASWREIISFFKEKLRLTSKL